MNNSVMKEEKKSASYYFHHPEFGHNCAQAVVYHRTKDEGITQQMKSFGGGRAKDGVCGALYGVTLLLKNDAELIKDVSKRFLNVAGSLSCRDIRKSGVVSCKECVDLADNLLTEVMGENA